MTTHRSLSYTVPTLTQPINRGFVYYDMEQYDAALADFDVYLRYKPNDPNDEKIRNAITWMLAHK